MAVTTDVPPPGARGRRPRPAEAAIAALEGNLWSMWRQFGLGAGCRLVDEPQLLRFETPLAHVPYNSVVRFRVEDRTDAAVDETLAAYAARRVPVMWLVHPTGPPDLGARLAFRGLVEAEVVAGMVARLDEVPELGADDPAPAGVEVREVHLGGEDPYIDLVTWRYGLPPHGAEILRSIIVAARYGEPGSPNRAWVAGRGGRVLSKVTLHHRGGVAGIYGVATRTEARGLGLARRLTLTALRAARASGAEIAVLHSTPMAVGLYRGLGFRRVADFPLHAMPGTLHL